MTNEKKRLIKWINDEKDNTMTDAGYIGQLTRDILDYIRKHIEEDESTIFDDITRSPVMIATFISSVCDCKSCKASTNECCKTHIESCVNAWIKYLNTKSTNPNSDIKSILSGQTNSVYPTHAEDI
jgi:septum formation topological specificity factor MinE